MKRKTGWTTKSWKGDDTEGMDAKTVQLHLTAKLHQEYGEPETEWVKNMRLKREAARKRRVEVNK